MTSWLGCRTLRCTGPALALLAPAAGDRGGGHALLEGGDARGARGDATGRRVVANRAATRGDLVGAHLARARELYAQGEPGKRPSSTSSPST